MHLTSFSSAEHRLLNVSARQIREEALARQQSNADATRSSQAFASTGGVNPNAEFIQNNVLTNYREDGFNPAIGGKDYTPEQLILNTKAMELAGASTVDATGAGNARVPAATTNSSLTAGAMGQVGATGDTTRSTNALGEIAQGAIDRLMKGSKDGSTPPMTYDQALQQVQNLRPSVQQTMSSTGQVDGYDPNRTATSAADKAESDVRARYSREMMLGSSFDPADIERDVQAARANSLKQSEIESTDHQNKITALKDKNAPSDSTPQNAAAPDPTEAASLQHLIGMLPPEMQGTIGPILQSALGSAQDMEGNATDLRDTREGTANDLFDTGDKRLKKTLERANSNFSMVEDVLKDSFEKQRKLLATSEENAIAQLEYREQAAVRKATEDLQQEMEERNATIALGGAIGSSNANNTLFKARQAGETAIREIHMEYGFKATDAKAFYTGKSVEAHQAYVKDWIGELDKYESKVSAVELGMEGNEEKKAERLDKAASEFGVAIEKAKEKQATTLKEAANLVISTTNQLRDDKRAQELLGWQRMEWASKTYGSGAPQAIIDSIKKQLPEVDVAGTLSSMTLAEMKQKKISSGGGGSVGGGVTFNSNQMQPDGKPISFDDYVNQKESAFKAANKVDTGNISPEYLALFGEGTKSKQFDRSAAALAQYKKEYELKVANVNRLNPTTIWDTLIDRNGNVTEKNVRESREATVKTYLANGEYEKAAHFVDGLGKPPSDSTSKSFSKAALAKQNVTRLANLIEDIGTTGPVVGRFRSANPYDDRVVEFNNLVRQTVPGLARGIFGEVGVLTDNDIKNYTATMANPNLTLDQARTATKNLLMTINLSIEDQLKVERAAGRATRDLTAFFATVPDFEFGNGPTQEDPDEAYANSILQH